MIASRTLRLTHWTRLISFLGAIAITGYGALHGSVAVIVLYLGLGVVGTLLVYRGGRTRVRMFALSYHLAILITIVLYAIYDDRWGQPYLGGGSDDRAFEKYAGIAAQSDLYLYNRELIASQIGNPTHNSVGYVYLVSYLMRFGDLLGGYDTMLPRLLNAFLLALCAIVTVAIAMKIGLSRRHSTIAGLWVALHPMMLFSSAHVFRDTLTALVLLLTLHLATSISLDPHRTHFPRWIRKSLTLVILAPVMASLRLLYLLPMLAMTAAAWTFRVLPIKRLRFWHAMLLLPIALAGILAIAPQLEILSSGLRKLEGYRNKYAQQADDASEGLSAALFSLPEPVQTVARVAYAIVTPLPILYRKIEWNLLGAGGFVQLLFAAYVFLGIRMIYRYTALLPLLVGFTILFAAYAFGTFTFRHITQWYPLAVLIGMVGYLKYARYRYVILGSALYSALVLAVTYVSIKVLS